MATILEIGDIHVEPGQRVMSVVDVVVGTHMVQVPVIAINGLQDGPRVAIIGGIHGAEYVGIETARQVGITVDPRDVVGSLVIVPVANTTALHARSIYTSGLDTNNINRMFPGKLDGAPSEALAHWLFHTIIRPSQYFIDLHGGDLIEALAPFILYLQTDDDAVDTTAREMALAMGIRHIVRTVVEGSAYAEAAKAGIPAIIAEMGHHGLCDASLVAQFRHGVVDVLRYLHVLPGEHLFDKNRRVYETLSFLRAPLAGLFYPQVDLGDTVEPGQCLGMITDYFGREMHRIDAPTGGEVLVVVTSLATNPGDILLGIVS